MPLRERQPCTHVHACMNTYTHILPYVHRHAQHEHSISHTYINTHTHINSLTHTHTTHTSFNLHTYIHINSPTIAFPSLSYFPSSLAHSLTHLLTYSPNHSLTHSPYSLTHILIHSPVHAQKLTHHHPSITLILPLPFLLFYAQSKSREVGNMWGYPAL